MNNLYVRYSSVFTVHFISLILSKWFIFSQAGWRPVFDIVIVIIYEMLPRSSSFLVPVLHYDCLLFILFNLLCRIKSFVPNYIQVSISFFLNIVVKYTPLRRNHQQCKYFWNILSQNELKIHFTVETELNFNQKKFLFSLNIEIPWWELLASAFGGVRKRAQWRRLIGVGKNINNVQDLHSFYFHINRCCLPLLLFHFLHFFQLLVFKLIFTVKIAQKMKRKEKQQEYEDCLCLFIVNHLCLTTYNMKLELNFFPFRRFTFWKKKSFSSFFHSSAFFVFFLL